MKKEDIIAVLAEKRNVSKKEADRILEDVVDIVKTGIKEDGVVDFPRFVKFTKTRKAATTMKNPRTGEVVDVPEKYAPKAKFSSTFKNELNA